MSVFSRTSGLMGENVSTEVLAYMLTPGKPFVPFQKLFFLRVCNVAKGSAELAVEVVTQPVLPGGTPDALILTEDTLVLLENKLGSSLSGDDQLVRYVRMLADDSLMAAAFPTFEPRRITRRILAFLAPRGIAAASVRQSDEQALKDAGRPFMQLCTDMGVSFAAVAWEDLVGDLDTDNALQRELGLYVENHIEQEMTMEEKHILNGTLVPTALDKLFKRITALRDGLSVPGFKPGRMGQSYNYFGFGIQHQDLQLWFGYSLPTWTARGSPLVLQIREAWIKSAHDAVITKAREIGFIKDAELEWMLPFGVKELEGWSMRLSDILGRFAEVTAQE